jgi:hypothetical protein
VLFDNKREGDGDMNEIISEDLEWAMFEIVMGTLLAMSLGLLGIIAYAYCIGLWRFII